MTLAVEHGDYQLHVIRSVRLDVPGLAGFQPQLGGVALHGPLGRSLVGILVAVPIPRTLGQAEVVYDAQLGHIGAKNTAVVKAAPDDLSTTPRPALPTLIPGQVAPAGDILAWAVGQRAAIFGHHAGYAWLLEVWDIGSVTVVARHVAYQVYASLAQGALRSTHRGGTGGI